MNMRQIKKLVHYVAKSTISELDVSDVGYSVRVRRTTGADNIGMVSPALAAVEPVVLPAEETEEPVVMTTVPALAVGLFYHQSSETSPAGIKIGQPVKKGEVLGTIKMMQVNNPVISTVDGFIESVLVENGQPVEYEQPLFIIG